MSDRPLQNAGIAFLQQYEHNNYYSLDSLKILQDELTYRRLGTYPKVLGLKVKVDTRLTRLEEIYDLLADSFEYGPFREWFFGDGEKVKIFEHTVTTGSTPLGEDEFDSFLRTHTITPYCLGEDEETLIIGRDDWNPEKLMAQLDLRSGKKLKIYSQEMVIAFLGCGKDPFDSGELLDYFGFGHPALEFLMTLGFDWPFTYAVRGIGTMPDTDWAQKGMLGHMGYKVGENGLPPGQRRQILKQVFETSELPRVESQEYTKKWGQAKSTERLRKIATSIANFAILRKKRRDSERLSLSIQHWESDLQWLKDNFYAGHFQFTWPDTFVGDEN